MVPYGQWPQSLYVTELCNWKLSVEAQACTQTAVWSMFNTNSGGQRGVLDPPGCWEMIDGQAVVAQVHCLQLYSDLCTTGLTNSVGIIIRPPAGQPRDCTMLSEMGSAARLCGSNSNSCHSKNTNLALIQWVISTAWTENYPRGFQTDDCGNVGLLRGRKAFSRQDSSLDTLHLNM